MTADADPTATAAATLAALQTRLHRLEFLLTGTPPTSASDPLPIPADSLRHQLAALSRDLRLLQAKSKTVAEIVSIHAQFPEVFESTHPAVPRAAAASLSPPEMAATLLMAATDMQSAASQLVAVEDTPVPDAALSGALVELLPRLQRVEVLQDVHARRIAELRLRSARVLEQWYLVGIEGTNECFAEWDERTFELEKRIARKVAAAREDY